MAVSKSAPIVKPQRKHRATYDQLYARYRALAAQAAESAMQDRDLATHKVSEDEITRRISRFDAGKSRPVSAAKVFTALRQIAPGQ